MPIWVVDQPSTSSGSVCAYPSSSAPARITTAPPAIHGFRIPQRTRLRSLSRPKIGVSTSATTPPMLVTTARFASLRTGSSK